MALISDEYLARCKGPDDLDGPLRGIIRLLASELVGMRELAAAISRAKVSAMIEQNNDGR